MKINQICYKIGIEDSYYFSRLFSQKMGMSPTEFRENPYAPFAEDSSKDD